LAGVWADKHRFVRGDGEVTWLQKSLTRDGAKRKRSKEKKNAQDRSKKQRRVNPYPRGQKKRIGQNGGQKKSAKRRGKRRPKKSGKGFAKGEKGKKTSYHRSKPNNKKLREREEKEGGIEQVSNWL